MIDCTFEIGSLIFNTEQREMYVVDGQDDDMYVSFHRLANNAHGYIMPSFVMNKYYVAQKMLDSTYFKVESKEMFLYRMLFE